MVGGDLTYYYEYWSRVINSTEEGGYVRFFLCQLYYSKLWSDFDETLRYTGGEGSGGGYSHFGLNKTSS